MPCQDVIPATAAPLRPYVGFGTEFTDPFLPPINRDGVRQHLFRMFLTRGPRISSLRLVTIGAHPDKNFESRCSKDHTSTKDGQSPGSRQKQNTTNKQTNTNSPAASKSQMGFRARNGLRKCFLLLLFGGVASLGVVLPSSLLEMN